MQNTKLTAKYTLSLFTLPDPELTQESSVDPLGIEPIWTAYGQRIFEQRLTTIANDLRIFTLNLHHHHFVNRLFLEEPEAIQQAMTKYHDWRGEIDAKTGMIIFLEDLVTHIFFYEEGNSNVDSTGILGMLKAKSLHNSTPEHQILIEANKRKGLLKNQLNLGMTGRYKGPMVNIGYFDRSFMYRQDAWHAVDSLFERWNTVADLQKTLKKFFLQHVLQSGGRKYPSMSLSEIRNLSQWKTLRKLYIQAFGSHKLPHHIKLYWKDKLGLNQGAARALLESLKIFESSHYSKNQLCLKALELLTDNPAETSKLRDIMLLERFLAPAEILFRKLSGPEIKTATEAQNKLDIIRTEINRFDIHSMQYVHPALESMVPVFINQLPFNEWLEGIAHYHSRIMDVRGGNPWIEIRPEGTIKHNYLIIQPEWLSDIQSAIQEDFWYHSYYFDTLRNIHLHLSTK